MLVGHTIAFIQMSRCKGSFWALKQISEEMRITGFGPKEVAQKLKIYGRHTSRRYITF